MSTVCFSKRWEVAAKRDFSNHHYKTLTNYVFISSGQENVAKAMKKENEQGEENKMTAKNKSIV